MAKIILLLIFNCFYISVLYSQCVCEYIPKIYSGFRNDIELVYEQYRKDNQKSLHIYRIDRWNKVGLGGILHDTDFYMVSIPEKLSYIADRIPSTYFLKDGSVILLFTGDEDKYIPDSCYLKSLFSILKKNIEVDDIQINSYSDFEYTIIDTLNDGLMVLGPDKYFSMIYKLSRHKIVGKIMEKRGGTFYYPVFPPYKYHYIDK